ncbi:MAG: hypothetical protein N2Z65_05545, partial [Clostridiales bacterium]|nr:hypothetical protein [Clostridiales bacterium]
MSNIAKRVLSLTLVATFLCSSLISFLQIQAAEKSISYSDMVKASVNAQGGIIEDTEFSYQLVFGKVGVNEVAGNDFSSQWGQDAVNYKKDSALLAYTATGLKSNSQYYNSMIKVTAKEPVSIHFTHPAMSGVQYASHTYIKTYHVVDGMPQIISSVQVTDQAVAADYYTPKTVVAKAGESVYWSFETSNEWGATAEFYPSVVIGDATEVTSDRLTLNDMVAGTVMKQGEPVNTEFVDYQFLTGKISSPLKMNTFVKDNGSGGWDDNWKAQYFENNIMRTGIEIQNMVGYPKSGNIITSQASTSDAFYDVIIKLEVNKNCLLDITHPVIPANEWRGTHTRMKVLVKKQGMRTLQLFEKTVTPDEIAANTYAVSNLSLEAGDTVYYIYTSVNEYGANIPITPTFSFTKSEYVPPATETESLTVSDFLLGMNESNGDPISSDLATFQILTGKVGSETKLQSFSDTKAELGWYNDSDTDKDKKTAFVSTTCLQASENHDAILKLTAKENISVNLSHPALTSWLGANGRFKITIQSGNVFSVVSDMKISDSNRTENCYVSGARELHLSKGDSLYLSLYTTNEWHFYADILPVFNLSTTSYDESQTLGKIIKDRETYKKAIDEFIATLSQSNYSAANWSSIQEIATSAKAAIDQEISALNMA